MVDQWYDREFYHAFLTSQKRDYYLPASLYSKIIKPIPKEQKIYILDFGTGLGYAALSIANTYNDYPNFKIFACDYQEPLLDQLWHTLTKKKITNITPFFIPSYSSVNFPSWLPKMNQIICSLSLSASKNPEEVIQTIHKIVVPNGFVHIVDWKVEDLPKELEQEISKENILNPETIDIYLRKYKYQIERTYLSEKYFFVISARVPPKNLV